MLHDIALYKFNIHIHIHKATPCKAEAEAEASVPWHKLVIMDNFLKPSCNTLNLSVSDASV